MQKYILSVFSMPVSKKYFNLLLLSAALVVWLIIFFRIIRQEDQDENNNRVSAAQSYRVKRAGTTQAPYLASHLKDPFATPFNRQQKIEKPLFKEQKKEVLKTLPRLELIGIIKDQQGKLAIVRFPDGITYFVREGQELDKIKFIKIGEAMVEFVYEKQKGTSSL